MTIDVQTTEQQPQLKRHVGIVGLLFASVGSIIGSGWLFGALNAAHASTTAQAHAAPGSMVGHVATYDKAMIAALAMPSATPAQIAARTAATDGGVRLRSGRRIRSRSARSLWPRR